MAKMKEAMKAEIACCALSSAITRRVARGVALDAAEAKALTRMDSENVLTVSMLDAMMVSRPSSAGCPMLGNPGRQRPAVGQRRHERHRHGGHAPERGAEPEFAVEAAPDQVQFEHVWR